MWNLKYDTNQHIYEKKNRLTDIENRLMVANGEERKVGKEWESGISRGKLLYVGWIHRKVIQGTIFNIL